MAALEKHGTYNPKHNDRSFEITNSEHIDPERVQQNIYWDCYNGIRSALQPKDVDSLADTFEEVEKLYYKLHYTNFTERQNERNAKIRHTERNRSTEDLLASKKTCPEESIYQLGTLESHASPKELFQIATEFMDEFHERFGKHVHILDWALHLDEGTPHIHERHVFDCENKYGEIAPQQEKALEALGFELPKPDKPLGRYNNRKITFDAACRTMLFEIAKRHGLELDEVPEYGGQAYLEKQDYILKKQNERIAEQKKELQEQSIQYVGLMEDCRNQRDEYAELFNQAIRQSEEISKNNEKIKSQENELEELFSQWVDVNDYFEIRQGAKCKSTDFYKVYERWCLDNLEKSLAASTFIHHLKDNQKSLGIVYDDKCIGTNRGFHNVDIDLFLPVDVPSQWD